MNKNYRSRKIGIGIDAGGTYTDAVIYDISGRSLLDKHKASTTRWDYSVGIRKALEGLNAAHFPDVEFVALSTTLATNAIVEGDGQKVGLLIMPPYGLFNSDDITLAPVAVIAGQMEINGEEILPVDTHEVASLARLMVERDKVKAFAVSGFAGSVNPAHELAVRTAIQEATGFSVTCGHELSDLLNFKTRAYTAVFNARLIPKLVQLLRQLEAVLIDMGITAPIAVVKGDGTLMSVESAVERPVETILSGPAASVSGARHLTGLETALVVDMGGTTTDTAALENGAVMISDAGSIVGGHQTHIRALAIRTIGLGGDSLIKWTLSGFTIGPRRVIPISWTGHHVRGLDEALAFADREQDRYRSLAVNMLHVLILSHEPVQPLSPVAESAVALLRDRPFTVAELIERTGAAYEGALDIETLEQNGTIERSGLTPVDLLHVTGQMEKWSRPTAERYLNLIAHMTGNTAKEMTEFLLSRITHNITIELLKRQLDSEIDPEAIDTCPVCASFLKQLFFKSNSHYTVDINLKRPVIGIGAPIAFFLPKAAAYLNAMVIIPEHADVANAIGAVTGHVAVSRRLHITTDSLNGFVVQGVIGYRRFSTVEQADFFARNTLKIRVVDEARKAGTSADKVVFTIEDQFLTADDGNRIFKGRVIHAILTGELDRV